MEECIITIPSPFDENDTIDLYLTLEKNTKSDVKIINGSPFITLDVKLNAKILSSGNNTNYIQKGNLELIEEYANSYINSKLQEYLYKISKNYNADIDLFGRYAVKYFPTWDRWIEYDWLENYKNSFFKVNSKISVISSYLIS